LSYSITSKQKTADKSAPFFCLDVQSYDMGKYPQTPQGRGSKVKRGGQEKVKLLAYA